MVPPNGANRGHYFSSQVDQLIETGQREMNMDIRKRAYQHIQQIVAEDLPYVSLFYLNNVCVYNKRIEGMKLYSSGGYEFLTHIRPAPSSSAKR
jgi:peptide/nickel transport system substrate-binding protein